MIKKKSKLIILKSAVGSMPSVSFSVELEKKGIEIIGIDKDPLSSGLYKIRKSHLIPDASDPKFLKQFIKICDKEKPNAILPGSEEEILILSQNKKLFNEKNILLLCPDFQSVKICTNKNKMYLFLNNLNLKTPNRYNKKNVKFPCVIKPEFGRGSKDVFVIHNKDELRIYLKQISKPIIQEYVKGVEYSIDILTNLEGMPLSIIPRIRLDTESGISTKTITVYDDRLIRNCKKIVKKLKLIGPCCIQCIKSGNSVKFIDINLRFGGGSILSLKSDPTIISNLKKIINKKTTKPTKNFKRSLVMLRYYNEVFISKNKILTNDFL